MLKYKTGQEVIRGDVVHIKNRAYTIHDFDEKSGFVYVRTMDERGLIKSAFPCHIGAYWDKVNPLFSNILATIAPNGARAA